MLDASTIPNPIVKPKDCKHDFRKVKTNWERWKHPVMLFACRNCTALYIKQLFIKQTPSGPFVKVRRATINTRPLKREYYENPIPGSTRHTPPGFDPNISHVVTGYEKPEQDAQTEASGRVL